MEMFNTELKFQCISYMYASTFPNIIMPIQWFGVIYMIAESLFIKLLVNMFENTTEWCIK